MNIKNIIRKARVLMSFPNTYGGSIDLLKFIHGQNLVSSQKLRDIDNIHDAEFKVYSQWGEDGIIQWALSKISTPHKCFIEFGVENYQESNTRFLMMHDNWRDLVMDGSEDNINFIKRAPYYWRHDLTAICSFITRENINRLFIDNGFTGDIGLLSIDIDGNDYWVWEAIDAVSPCIVVCEYNSIYGYDKKVTVPYREDFLRHKAHYSYLYFGASIGALIELGRKKGYSCIGSNSAGNNVFFVRNDYKGLFNVMTSQQAHVVSMFRESRGKDGSLSFVSGEDRLKLIKDMPLYDIDRGETALISEIFGLEA